MVKKKKTYEAEFCLPCLMCNQESIADLARVFVLFGWYLRQMGEGGVVLNDRKLLEEGIVSFESDDPAMATFFESFQNPLHKRHSDNGHEFN